MHRIPLGKRFGRTRRRALVAGVLGLAGAGLATAVWATQAASGDDAEALARTIKRQKIRSGILVAQGPGASERKTKEHQAEALTSDQIIELASSYETEIREALEHAEMVRVGAYRSRDIIRMTCIDDKLAQMRSVFRIVEPRFVSIRGVRHDELIVRGQFSLIQQAVERVRALASEMEDCLGETLDVISGAQLNEGLPSPTSARETDPTRPQEPGASVDRPPEASSYR